MAKAVLHVGCGGSPLPEFLGGFHEVRLDIDPSCKPDIVASMLDMGDVGLYDCVFSQHSLEHVYTHEVHTVLSEFNRVLKDGGTAVVFVPDVEGVTPSDDVLFESPAGPITGMDLIYGYQKMIEEKPYMAHKTGFTKQRLYDAFEKAGFSQITVIRMDNHALMGAAKK